MPLITMYWGKNSTNNIKEIKFLTSDILIYDLPRSSIRELSKVEHANRTAIYHLLNSDASEVYIGQTDNLTQRITSHSQNDFEWDRVLACVSLSDFFNQAHAKYLEYLLTQRVREIGIVEVISGADVENNLDAPGKELAQEYADIIFEIFDKIGVHFYTNIEESNNSQKEEFFIGGPDAKGVGFYTNGSFLVKEGTLIRKEIVDSVKDYIGRQRKLQEKNFKDHSETQFILTEDVLFKTPSSAAGFILARSVNGWIEWKNSEGKTLSEIYR